MKTSKMLDGYPQRSCAALPSPLAPDLPSPPPPRLPQAPLRRRYAAPLCAASPRTRGAAAPLR